MTVRYSATENQRTPAFRNIAIVKTIEYYAANLKQKFTKGVRIL